MSHFPLNSILNCRIAEALIEEILLNSGWKVQRTGIESPALLDRCASATHPAPPTASAPDLRVQKESTCLNVAVNYRGTGQLTIAELPGYPDDTLIIVVYRGARKAAWDYAWFIKQVRFGDIKDAPSIDLHTDARAQLLDAPPFSLNPVLITEHLSELRQALVELNTPVTTEVGTATETDSSDDDSSEDSNSDEDSAEDSSGDDSPEDASSDDDSPEDTPADEAKAEAPKA